MASSTTPAAWEQPASWEDAESWDEAIFTDENNQDFLDELVDLDDEDVVESVREACLLAAGNNANNVEISNGYAAATIAAIWSGAPFFAGEIVSAYPFVRELVGSSDEQLTEAAAELLGELDVDFDLDPFLEALS